MHTHPMYLMARHESSHVLCGELLGHRPEAVTVSPRSCHTVLVYPMCTADVSRFMADNPHMTALRLAEIVATVMAGSLAEGVLAYGRDAQDMRAWEAEYVAAGAEPHDWVALRLSVERTLSTWARYPAVGRAIDTMAGILCQASELKSRAAVETLLAAADVYNVPIPAFSIQTPSRQRWGLGTGITSNQVRRVERPRVAARTAVARPVPRAGLDKTVFALAEDRQTKRYLRLCCCTYQGANHALGCPEDE